MKSALKLLLPLLVLGTVLSTMLFTAGCKDDLLTTDTSTVANTNVRTYRNVVVNEFFTDLSFSSLDLYAGTNLLANDATRDAELADSSAFGPDVFYIRSGDGTQDNRAPGLETKFVPFFSTRSATFSEAQFNAISRIDVNHDSLLASDFTKYSTYSFGSSFVSNDIRVYGFWLKGKKVAYGLSREVYGIMYLRSVEDPATGFRLVVDIKINTNGKNDFRERIPVGTTN